MFFFTFAFTCRLLYCNLFFFTFSKFVLSFFASGSFFRHVFLHVLFIILQISSRSLQKFISLEFVSENTVQLGW